MKMTVQVDRTVCMWCGSCVGCCHKNAITLYETRVEFDESCNDCGVCVIACPVGAITGTKLK